MKDMHVQNNLLLYMMMCRCIEQLLSTHFTLLSNNIEWNISTIGLCLQIIRRRPESGIISTFIESYIQHYTECCVSRTIKLEKWDIGTCITDFKWKNPSMNNYQKIIIKNNVQVATIIYSMIQFRILILFCLNGQSRIISINLYFEMGLHNSMQNRFDIFEFIYSFLFLY